MYASASGNFPILSDMVIPLALFLAAIWLQQIPKQSHLEKE